MEVKVVTTITSRINLDGLGTEHSVVIEPDPEVPSVLAYAAAAGGCKAALKGLQPHLRGAVMDIETDEDEEETDDGADTDRG